jgi:hypothetical protein
MNDFPQSAEDSKCKIRGELLCGKFYSNDELWVVFLYFEIKSHCGKPPVDFGA